MSDDEKLAATLDERSKNQAVRIDKLETNQKWGVMTILALLLKAAFDYMSGGGR